MCRKACSIGSLACSRGERHLSWCFSFPNEEQLQLELVPPGRVTLQQTIKEQDAGLYESRLCWIWGSVQALGNLSMGEGGVPVGFSYPHLCCKLQLSLPCSYFLTWNQSLQTLKLQLNAFQLRPAGKPGGLLKSESRYVWCHQGSWTWLPHRRQIICLNASPLVFDEFAFVGDMSKMSEKSALPDFFLKNFYSVILPSFYIYWGMCVQLNWVDVNYSLSSYLSRIPLGSLN